MKKELWAARVNLSGLWDNAPVRVKWNGEQEYYTDASGNLGFSPGDILRYDDKYMVVVFASENKAEVKAFIAGARAVYHILRAISGGK